MPENYLEYLFLKYPEAVALAETLKPLLNAVIGVLLTLLSAALVMKVLRFSLRF